MIKLAKKRRPEQNSEAPFVQLIVNLSCFVYPIHLTKAKSIRCGKSSFLGYTLIAY